MKPICVSKVRRRDCISFNFPESAVKLKKELPTAPIALVIDSFGGNAEAAYCLSVFLRRRCKGFIAVVPKFAKSAATLLALGADKIILADEAELGPIDAQFRDYDVEEKWVSALDTVQAVEQLEDSAIEVAMKMLRSLQSFTNKSYNLLLRHALRFSAEITKPLFEKIDSVSYSRLSRILREAQDYASRLLQPKFTVEQAEAIARDLVNNYPTHAFVINREESARIGSIIDKEGKKKDPVGLHVFPPVDEKMSEILDNLARHTDNFTAFGRLV